MRHFLYMSASVGEADQSELDILLEQARRNNRAYGLTGMLIYRQGVFIQYLEGEAEPLNIIKARIVTDRRHMGLVTLSQGESDLPDRLFPDWSMGFSDIAGRPDAFELSLSALSERLPEETPIFIRSLMQTIYADQQRALLA